MSALGDSLYRRWLPAWYRVRDAALAAPGEDGGPLAALLELAGAEGDRVDRDLEQLYDDWFIETCEDWLVPYLGDLLGVRDLAAGAEGGSTPRAYVANTLRYRRRKGTASMLEQLARDVTGWPAVAVEFWARLGATQHVNHPRPACVRTPDLRDAGALERVGTPFETATRTADVRRIEPLRGRWNLPQVGLFLWRLRAYPVRGVPAFDHGGGRFSFSPLGHDAPLFHRPAAEDAITHLATEANVPGPIGRRAFLGETSAFYGTSVAAPGDLFLRADGVDVGVSRLEPCHLGGWVRQPSPGRVAVDPVLGRVAFPAGEAPASLEVCVAYGFSADLGGGPYEREPWPVPGEARIYVVGGSTGQATLADALAAWLADGRPTAVVEVVDSRSYPETGAAGGITVSIPAGRTLVIRAGRDARFREWQRPLFRLPAGLSVSGEAPADPAAPGGRFVLEGVLLSAGPLRVLDGDLGELIVRQATLVPGGDLTPDGDPVTPGDASVEVVAGNARLAVSAERVITGAIRAGAAAAVTLRDTIVDAHGGLAVAAPAAALTAGAVTVFGSVEARTMALVTNSLATGAWVAERRQEGCVRYSFLPEGSRVPRRHRCQPEAAVARAVDAREQQLGRRLTEAERAAVRAPIVARIEPMFTDRRYGQPGYAQLHARVAAELASGADDEAELGAFHHLRTPVRRRGLRAALDEYLRAGLEAGIFTVS